MQLRIALLLVRRILTLYSTVLSLPLPHATPHCPASRPQNSHTLQHCAQPPSAPCNSALPCFSSAEFSHSTALCSASLCPMQLRIALLLVRRILTLYSTVLSLPLR